ncbi:receptor-like protein kinase 5 [Lactuca sativa]|uniref:Protein kinase domain-containing protein n=1 Tax=Lactuca sativa TaxID=4236 RepID=A0A9R1V627_LACSA|nr:receptor-like protein kinase 5 [Lactuca sativa]KAJ0199182.1 hypothetical protein LSAT_V11C600303740 [Lactuca sativa]
MTRVPRPTPLNIFFSFLFIVAVEFSCANSQQFLTSERATLLSLKQQWGNPPSLNNWNATSSPCNWPGVLCNSNSSVIILVLQSKGLIGRIPPFICDHLRNLENLDLTNNFLTGEFPRVLYNCSKLVEIDIAYNGFVGRLPDDIDRLSSRLKTIDIGGNNFTGDIPPAIGNLSSLISLYMYGNLLNGSIPPEIGNLSNLLTLNLAYNRFTAAEIPSEFGKLSNLTYLLMHQSNLIGKIPESLANLSSLECLDFSSNNLEDEIPSGLFLLKNLRILFLYFNALSGKIPAMIESLNLTEIDLSENKLNGSIPDDFGKLQQLEVLSLFLNQLSGNIPAGISQIPTLRIFKVFSNKLDGELPSEIGLHSKLEAFDVAGNKLTGKLPENLCGGGTLFTMVAFSNNLTGEIPNSLQSCEKLRSVQLYNNSFTGELPPGIWTLSNLSSLRLTGNFLSGELPITVPWNLSRLEISDNKFSGQIPEGISSWTKLNVFKASNNMFTGEIPATFTHLSQLSVLHLDGNSLSGQLPSEIKSWNSLTTLHLARNKLSGPIPPAISYLKRLLDLDLSENQLSGTIPPELSRLRLNTLNLSSNKLTGRIPFTFDNLAFQNSFLNNPNLCASSQISNLHKCYSKSSSRPSKIIVLSAFIILVTILCTLFVVLFRRHLKHKHIHDLTIWNLTSFHILDFTESNILSSLTENNQIGSGGSGKVYQIEIGRRHGEYVAAKMIWNPKKLDDTLEKEFLSEIHILGSIRHSNIIKLLCCISSEDSKILVYEYMENRSLDKWLHGKKRKTQGGLVHPTILDWPRRLQIAIGAAQGLCYMHHHCSPAIIHRDIKSSNILLDSDFKAKIADFGLAKILTSQTNTMSAIAGSFGYIPPEYAYSSKVNARVDVYSFGVVLLELVTGKEAHEGDEDMNLAEWACRNYSEGKSVVEALDPEIKQDDSYMEEIRIVFKLGLICTSTLPSSRPQMKEVLGILLKLNLISRNKVLKEGTDVFDDKSVKGC